MHRLQNPRRKAYYFWCDSFGGVEGGKVIYFNRAVTVLLATLLSSAAFQFYMRQYMAAESVCVSRKRINKKWELTSDRQQQELQ